MGLEVLLAVFGLALFTAFVGFLLHVFGFVDLTYGGSQSDFFSAYGGLLMVSPLLTWVGMARYPHRT